jgi:uncharacterized protein YdaU (DUF1376 family)
MAKPPAFQFYAKDFLTGTMLMSNEEVGLYIRLLCLQWEQGYVPDDVERIVAAFGETTRRCWTAVKPKFNHGSTEGELRNEKLEKVRAQQTAFRERQSEKGKASAEARRSKKATKPRSGNRKSTTDQPRFNQTNTEGEPLAVVVEDNVLRSSGKERAHEVPPVGLTITPPYPDYFPDNLRTKEFFEWWHNWIKHRREIGHPLKDTMRSAQMAQMSEWGPERAVAAMRHTITKGWQGLREPDRPTTSDPATDRRKSSIMDRNAPIETSLRTRS